LRKIENTAAASVAETTAPNNNPSSKLKSRMKCTNMPTVSAVMNTPIVESEIPRHAIGFMTASWYPIRRKTK
jgi:hypothetical protein